MNQALRRRLFMLAIRDYPGASNAFAAGIDAQLAEAQTWWCAEELGDRALRPESLRDVKSRREAEQAVQGLRDLSHTDVVVVYVTGHGIRGNSGRHYLALPDTPHGEYAAHGYPTADLVTAVLQSEAEHVLVIVNACFAGELHAELAAFRKDLPARRRKLRSLAVFATADFDERPEVDEFTLLLAEVRQWLTTRAGYVGEWLSFDDFAAELDRARSRLPGRDWLEILQIWRAGPADQPSPCLPNPGYQRPDDAVGVARRQVATSAGELDYWLDRASGRVSTADSGWYFSGRRALTAELARFLIDGSGLLLVTGAAGTGKSAIVARAVTLSDPEFRNNPRYADALKTAPADTIPPSGSVAAAVLARNKTTGEIAVQLITALGVEPAAVSDATQQVTVLRGQLEETLRQRGPTTIVLDGLDEAVDASLLVIELVGPLLSLCRMVIGVRSATPGRAPDGHGRGLVDLLRRVGESVPISELRTDGPDARRDIQDYLTALLAIPYANNPVELAPLAALVAGKVAPSFLDARFAARRLRDSHVLLTAAAPELRGALNEGTISLLRQDIADTATDDHPREMLLAVLRAAAFAQGGGVPWADIWPTMASTLSDRPITDEAVEYVVGSRLGGYLARDVEDGRLVHRPVHESLASVLRGEAHRLIEPMTIAGSPAIAARVIHRRITERLRARLPSSPDLAPHPYLRRHLVRHAINGQVLDDRHFPVELLPWETSGEVRASLGLPVDASPFLQKLAAYAAIEPFLGDALPSARALSIDVAMTAGALPPSNVIHPPGLRPCWARWTLTRNVLAHNGSPVHAVAAVPLVAGRTLVASGGDDGAVRLWDATTGTALATLVGHAGSVRALAAMALPDGQIRLASGGDDGTVRIWDPVVGSAVGVLDGHVGGVRAIAVMSRPDGLALAVVSGGDGSVRLWDPVKAALIAPPASHVSGVRALETVSAPDGRILLAIGGDDGTVRLWDPDSDVVGPPLIRHLGAVCAVTAGPGWLASGGDDGMVQVWNPVGKPVLRTLKGHASRVETVTAVPQRRGGELVASGSDDGSVRLWTVTSSRIRQALAGHAGKVAAVTAVPLPGDRVLVASGGEDGTVRLWDPESSVNDAAPTDSASSMLSVAAVPQPDGKALLATAALNGAVQLWEPMTGEPIGELMTGGHMGGSLSAALVPLADGGVLLASAAFSGWVRLWNPATGHPVGSPLLGAMRDTFWAPPMATVPQPDGTVRLAIGDQEGTIWMWDAVNGERTGISLSGHSGWMGAAAAVRLPDGRELLAIGEKDGSVRLWDTTTGDQAGDPLLGHTGQIHAAASMRMPDGAALLATGDDTGVVRLWDLVTGTEQTRIVVGSPVTGLAAHPAGPAGNGFLAVAGSAGVAALEIPLP